MRRLTRAGLAVVVLVGTLSAGSPLQAQSRSARAPQYDRLKREARTRGTVRVIVGLRTPTPVRPEARLSRSAVESQRANIATSRNAFLDRMALQRLELRASYQTIPYVAVEVDEAAFDAIASSPEVTTVVEDLLTGPTLASSIPVIGADRAADQGFIGAGQAVAILDTGVEASHSFFGGRVVWEGCFSTTYSSYQASTLCPNGQDTMLGIPGAASPSTCTGIAGCDHGTHVAGIAAGSGSSFAGVARGANLIGIQVFTRFDDAGICGSPPCLLSFQSDQIAALEQVYALRGTFDIAAASLSLGGGRYTSTCDAQNPAYADIINQLRGVGIATVIASGNNGFSDGTSSPGCISTAVTVGATWDDDRVASFSNSAAWVDLLAPGVLIESSITGNRFGTMSGTSMATPHVSGAFAVLKAATPSASVDDLLNALRDNGVMLVDPKSSISTPRIQVDAAIAVQPLRITTPALPPAVAGAAYSTTIAAEGGSPPLEFSLETGTLPVALEGPARWTGIIDGTPFEAGFFPIRVRVTDALGRFDERDLSVSVGLGAPTALQPFNDAVTNDADVTFTWSTVVGASAYHLVLEDTTGLAVLDREGIPSTSLATNLNDGNFLWRVQATTNTVTSNFSAATAFEVDTTPPGAVTLDAETPSTLSRLGPVTAIGVSGELSGFVKENAVDGNLETFWASPLVLSSQEESITLDLGDSRLIGRVRLHPRLDTTAAFPRDFEIQISEDNVHFDTVHAEADFVVSGAEWQTFDFALATGRYLRLRITELNHFGPSYFDAQIAEVEVYETIPPTGAVSLHWMATGDDGNTGTATAYDLRYSEGSVFDWSTATPVPAVPVPEVAGSAQEVLVTGLLPETDYSFAMRVVDNADNFSTVSTPIVVTTPGTPPGPIQDLGVVSVGTTTVTLEWSAPFDDGDTGGAVASYDARFSQAPITEANFASASETPGEPVPGSPGTRESMQVSGLISSTLYYFAVKSIDRAGNMSLVSNVAIGQTTDGLAPAPILDLTATPQTGGLGKHRVAAVAGSSGVLSGFVEGNAIDDDPSTFWASPLRGVMQNEFITLDLGATVPVVRARFLSRADTALAFPRKFSIQASDDNVSFETLRSELDFVAAAGTWYDFDLPVTDARYLRIFVTESNRFGIYFNVQLAEIEVYRQDPAADAVTLFWTATGNDGDTGIASFYDIRYSDSPILPSTFDAATPVPEVPAPLPSGSPQSLVVSGLGWERSLYFSVRAVDDNGNASDVVPPGAQVTTPGLSPDAPVLEAVSFDLTSVTLEWMATADDGSTGAPATSYVLRYSTSPIVTVADFLAASPFDLPAPQSPGVLETARVSALSEDTLYYFALRILDDVGNASALSNVVSRKTLDDAPPASILDLTATLSVASHTLRPATVQEVSGELSTFLKENAVDSNLDTFWSAPLRSSVVEEHLTLDLGSTRSLSRVRLHPRRDTTAGFPRGFEIQASDDGESFTTVRAVADFVATAATWLTYDFDPIPARYIRILITETSPFGVYRTAQIAEIEVYEDVPQGVMLSWTATGDNAHLGRASSYDVRFAQSPITNDSDFSAATPLDGEPEPGEEGTPENFVVTDVPGESELHFAVRAFDEAGNGSEIRGSASVLTPDIAPGAVDDLRATPETGTSVRLTWTAVGDDGNLPGGAATSYDVRLATAPIEDLSDFEASTPVASGVPAPAFAGSEESFVIDGLAPGIVYYFALRVADEVPNVSPVSNVAASTTADTIPPDPIRDLAASLAPPALETVGTVSAHASSELSTFFASAALDGNLDSFWGASLESTVRTEWLAVELNETALVGQVRLHPRADTTAAFPRDFEIQVSLDNLSFVTVHTEANFVASEVRWYEFAFSPVAARFVRILVTETAPFGIWRTVQLAEVEIHKAAASRVLLTWTAPGDDGADGTATSYEVRYSTSPVPAPVTETQFDAMAAAGGLPASVAAGGQESFTVTGLATGTYYFVVKTIDDSGNSSLSLQAPSVNVP